MGRSCSGARTNARPGLRRKADDDRVCSQGCTAFMCWSSGRCTAADRSFKCSTARSHVLTGGLSKTFTAPLETVRMQMMTGAQGNVLHVLKGVWADSGFLGFFSGNSADVLRTMPSKAIELTSYDMYKRLLSWDFRTGKRRPAGAVASTVAGAMAGSSSSLLLFPLETVRTRLAVDSKKYTSIAGTFHSIVMNEGVLSLYKGVGTSLMGAIPYAAIRLALFDGLKLTCTKVRHNEELPPAVVMACGAAAAIAATAATFPLEVVRRRMMMGGPRAYPHAWAALTGTAQKEGFGSLYRGLGLTCVKQAPQQAITLYCYDLLKQVLQTEQGHRPVKA